jgi:hypothetical protein
MSKFKSILRNVVAIAISLAVTTTFISCGDDDDNGNGNGNAATITATTVTGNTAQIATVKAEIWWWDEQNDYSLVIAEAPFRNNGFALQLPETVPNNFLFLFNNEFEDSDITVNPANARGTALERLEAFNAAGNEIGWLYYADFDWYSENHPNVRNSAFWLFVDRDVTITGEESSDEWEGNIWIESWNLNLRRGWNIVYERLTITTAGNTTTYTNTFTSQRPSGVNFSWRFSADDVEENSLSAKSVDRKGGIFLRGR